MNTSTTTVAATLLGLSSAIVSGPAAAGPVELAPLQGYAISLGAQTAAVYFREQDDRKELVTTIASADFAAPGARNATLIERGARATLPLLGTGPVVLIATDHGDHLIIEVGVDFGRGREVADVLTE